MFRRAYRHVLPESLRLLAVRLGQTGRFALPLLVVGPGCSHCVPALQEFTLQNFLSGLD
jgi:hypothetical protein